MEFSNTYARIDLDAITANYRCVCRKAGVPVMAVIKADAYGHGAVAVARALSSECGFFGVSSMAEALELRRAGISQPILILGYTDPACYQSMVRNQIRPTIFSYEDAQKLSETAAALGETAHVHLAVDTGMGRLGFQATGENADVCAAIAEMKGLEMEGLFSHFATADEPDPERSFAQARRFDDFNRMLRQRGVEIGLRHLDNSAGILNFDNHYDMVRAGIVLYGLYPDSRMKKTLALRPAMSWHSHVSQVKRLPPGRELSYGATFVTRRDTVVATVTAGYADGYRRNLSNRFYVLIRGQKAMILGRICMDQLLVDVTDIPGVKPGDEVVLLGRSGDQEITAEALSSAAGSFPYEQICDLSRRVARVYIRDGRPVESVNYLLQPTR